VVVFILGVRLFCLFFMFDFVVRSAFGFAN
jgi:hypothetical protein